MFNRTSKPFESYPRRGKLFIHRLRCLIQWSPILTEDWGFNTDLYVLTEGFAYKGAAKVHKRIIVCAYKIAPDEEQEMIDFMIASIESRKPGRDP